MTKRHRRYENGNGNVFNVGTVINVLFIPILTVLFGIGGFYFLTNNTLSRHETAITETIPAEFKQEAAEREKTRSEFLDKLQKLNDGINTLSTNVAVQGEQNKQIAVSLEKISNQLRPDLGHH